MRATTRLSILPIIVFVVCGCLVSTSTAQDYIDGGKAAAIGVGSAGLGLAGWLALDVDSSGSGLITGPLPLERQLQRLLGGSCYAGKSNFLDNSLGSAVTPLLAGAAMLTADLEYSQGDKSKTVFQDLFLYTTGLIATSGVTDVAKGLVARERPILCLHPEIAAQRKDVNNDYDRHSFFSGHTSSAFFAVTFANKRIRSVMRSEMSSSGYKDWRWLPSTVFYGWAGFVGWSRIHSYKHFVSDVVVGALAGYLLGELFYSFGKDAYSPFDDNGVPMTLSISIKF